MFNSVVAGASSSNALDDEDASNALNIRASKKGQA